MIHFSIQIMKTLSINEILMDCVNDKSHLYIILNSYNLFPILHYPFLNYSDQYRKLNICEQFVLFFSKFHFDVAFCLILAALNGKEVSIVRDA